LTSWELVREIKIEITRICSFTAAILAFFAIYFGSIVVAHENTLIHFKTF